MPTMIYGQFNKPHFELFNIIENFDNNKKIQENRSKMVKKTYQEMMTMMGVAGEQAIRHVPCLAKN